MSWKEDIVGNVIEKIATGKTPPTANKEYFDGDIYWYTPSDIINNIALNCSSRTITQKAIEDKKAIIYEPDTLLITCIGNIGRLGLTTKKSSSNQQITGLKFKPFIYPQFAFYYFLFMQSHLSQKANNAVVPILNNAGLKEIKIRYPDLKIQLEIAHVLEQADKALQQRKAANALTDQFLQSSFLSLFGDPVKNEKGWDKTELKNLISSIDSGWSPVCEENPRTNENQWAVLKLGAVTYCEFNPLENKKMLEGVSPKESIEVKKDDLLFTRKNTKDLVAATAYVFDTPGRLQMSDTIFRLKYIEEKVSGIFLWYMLLDNNFRKEVQSLATGSSGSMPNISKEKLMKLLIPLPPLSLQQQFAGIVAQAEQLRQKQKESERELENLFQGLLQRYFG